MLAGKVAIVTGSTSGIGLAIAGSLAAKGANVVLNSFSDRREDHAIAERLSRERNVEAVYVQSDMWKPDDCRGLVDAATRRFGAVDILVNNAGTIEREPAAGHTDELWDQVIDVNLTAQFIISREVGRRMIKNGGGKIIFTASLLSFQGGINVPGYAASKGGVDIATGLTANIGAVAYLDAFFDVVAA
jgi:2-dehydro-3-deoxy-D-gluconate 5-dehydrogenase